MIDKQDVYYRLCDQINKLGFGFDHTPEQHELSLFKRFYTPEEAQWSLEMPLDCFFTAADFAEKTGRTVQEAQRICEVMAMQGQIYREIRDRTAYYRVQPMIAGIWEAHIKLMQDDIDAGRKDWIVDENQHIATHYEVVIDEDKCLGDGACLEVCPSASASINPETGKIFHDDQCLACGQCVSRCPTGALTMRLKPREQRPDMPDNLWDMYETMQAQRKANGFLE